MKNNQQEKEAFIAALAETPCKEGQDAFLAFPGSIEQYFDTHPRRVRDFLWCVEHGLLYTSWVHLATPQRLGAFAEAILDWRLAYATALEFAAARGLKAKIATK